MSPGAISSGPIQTTISVTTSQFLLTDNDGDGQYDPGDLIQNVLTITNTGGLPATGLSFTDTLSGSTLVAGSVKISPVAVDDVFTMSGNTPITFTAAQLLGNDLDPDGSTAGLSVTAVSNAQHGTIVNNGNGTFTFTPTTGYTGAASFDYAITDAQGLTNVTAGSVALTVTGQVWYVDSGASAGGADGSYAHPFTSLTAINAANGSGDLDGVNDTIVAHGAFGANLVLEAGQKLYGDGGTLVVNGLTVTSGVGTTTLSAASNNVVTLSTDNTIDGLTINGSGTIAIADNGGSVSGAGAGLSLAHLNIGGAQSGLQITHGGAVNGTITSLATTGGVTALNLAGTAATGTGLISGTLSVTGGSISGDTGTAIKIGSTVANSGGAISVNYGGNISATGTGGIDINNMTGGTVSFTGQNIAISTGANTGVTLSGNATAATVTFNPTAGGTGFDITTTSGAAFVANGGTLNVQGAGNSIQTATGHVVDFTGVTIGASGVSFASLASTGTVVGTGILLSNVDGGSFSSGTATIAGASNTGIAINGGTSAAITFGNTGVAGSSAGINISGNGAGATTAANVTFNGTVAASTGGATAIYIDSNGGTIAFTGSSKTITTTSAEAIHVGSNAAAVSFTGGSLVVNSTSGTGIAASAASPGGGSLTISGTGNTVTTTTGTAVSISNVNETVTLQSVTSSNSAHDGIYLNNAGSGGFTVTGTGTTAGSGGTLTGGTAGADGSNTDGIAVFLNNVSNVQLSNLNVAGTWNNFGIRGESVTNFGLHDSNLTGTFGNNGGIDEGAIRFGTQGVSSGLIGTGLFDGNTIGGGYEDNLDLYLYGANVANVTIKDSASHQAVFNNTQNPGTSGSGNDNIHVESGNTSNLTLLIDGVTVNGAHGDLLQVVAADSTTQNLTVQNSSFNDSGAGTAANTIGGGVFIGGGGSASNYNTTFNFSNNTVVGAKDTAAAFLFSGQAATVSGIIANNTIGNPNGSADGSGSKNGNGIEVDAQHFAGAGTVNVAVRIQGNQIADWANAGIALYSNSGGGGTTRLEATVLSNTAKDGDATFGLAPFYALVGGQSASDPSLLGLNISSNIFTAPANAAADIYLDQLQTNNTAHFYLPGYTVTGTSSHGEYHPSGGGGTASTNLTTFWNGLNTLSTVAFPTVANTKVDGTLTFGITNSSFFLGVPLIAVLPSETFPVATGDTPGGDTPAPVATDLTRDTPHPLPVGPTAPVDPAPAASAPHNLTQSELDGLVASAIGRWEAAGATPDQLAALHAVTITVADMIGDYVGSAKPGQVLIDADAAGLGWFIDATPGDDAEFADVGGRLSAVAQGALGHVDLLSVLTHELGHQIGLLDRYASSDVNDIMYGYINAGERRAPTSADVAAAGSNAVGETGYLIGPINAAATLPAGKAINVFYQSTVSSFTPGANSFSNTATVSGTNIASATTGTRTFSADSLSLGNLVFNDANHNGIYDGGDSGIGGVTVGLYLDANNDDVADGGVVLTAVTAGNGAYSFANLPEGNYIIGIDKTQAPLSGLGTVAGASDPDDNVDNDNNGVSGGTNIVYSKAITLNYNQEPTAGVGNDTNFTLDFGFGSGNAPPAIANLAGDSVGYTEDAAAVRLDSGTTVSVTDATNANFNGGSLTVAVTTNKVAGEDRLGLTTGGAVSVAGNVVTVSGTQVGTVAGLNTTGADLVFTLNAGATPALIATLMHELTYLNTNGGAPSTATRTVSYTLVDGSGPTGGAGSDTATVTSAVTITAVDDAPVAVADVSTTAENATKIITVLANDTDVDGGTIVVARVDGVLLTSGQSTTLASGAVVTLNANNTLSYDPSGQFAYLNAQSSTVDRFTYTLNGGSQSTVAMTVTGVSSGEDANHGSSRDDVVVGNGVIDVSQGGNDVVTGGSGADGFFFGAAFTIADQVTGGLGNDSIGLQGDYTGANALVLGAGTISGIETIAALSGFSYDITTNDANIAAGQILTVYGSGLGAGDNLTFNGSAETDGRIVVYGGLGIDTITTGAGDDGIYFGRDGRFGASDHVDGGAGNDQLALDGSYSITVSSTQIVNIETLALLDGSAAPAIYAVTLADDWALPGETKTIYASGLRAGAIIDGHLETNANFVIYGGAGADTISGGGGNDRIFGGLGADTLNGGLGADTFGYGAVAQSIGSSHDTIIGFNANFDKIDLPGSVTAVQTNVTGAASNSTLDADLTSALAGLGVNHAVQFTATSGDLNGHVFEVIDANGIAGYQAGQDYVIELQGMVAPIIDPSTFI